MTAFITRARDRVEELFDGRHFQTIREANELSDRVQLELRYGAPYGSEEEFAIVRFQVSDLEWTDADTALVSVDGTSTDPEQSIIIHFTTTVTEAGFTLKLAGE